MSCLSRTTPPACPTTPPACHTTTRSYPYIHDPSISPRAPHLRRREECDRICALASLPPALSAYRVLSLSPHSSLSVITSRYRTLLRMVHPDKCDHPNASLAFRTLREAYAWLSRPSPSWEDVRTLRLAIDAMQRDTSTAKECVAKASPAATARFFFSPRSPRTPPRRGDTYEVDARRRLGRKVSRS